MIEKIKKKIKQIISADNFATYVVWATIQHAVVMSLAWPWDINLGLNALLATIVFGPLFHSPNAKLVAITTVMGFIMYFLLAHAWASYGAWASLLFLAYIPLHASIALWLKKRMNLAVWLAYEEK